MRGLDHEKFALFFSEERSCRWKDVQRFSGVGV